MAATAVPASGTSELKPGRGLHRTRQASAEPLFRAGTLLGDVEQALRAHGPGELEKLAALLGRDEADVLDALHRHPMCFTDSAGEWSIVRKVHPDFEQPLWDAEDLGEPREEHPVVVCPFCGSTYTVPQYTFNKIQRGARSARCAGCAAYGPLPAALDRGPLCPRDFERFAPFWLERFSDVEVRDMAFALGVEDARVERVAAWRERVLRGGYAQASGLQQDHRTDARRRSRARARP